MFTTELQRAVRACFGSLFVLTLFSVCINALALASPLYMLQLYDRVLSSRSLETLVFLTLIVVLALALLSFLDGLRRFMLSRLGAWLEARLSPVVLRSAVAFSSRSDATLAKSAMSDLTAVRSFLSGPAIAPMMDAPWSPIFIAVLFLLHPILGAIGLASAAFLFALAVLNEGMTRGPLQTLTGVASHHQQLTQSVLRNADVVRAMGMLDGVQAVLQHNGKLVDQAQQLADRRSSVILAVSKFSRLFVQTLIMGAGAWLVIQDNASAGLIFASSFLLSRALAPIDNAMGAWKSFTMARIAYRRLNELLRMTPQAHEAMELPQPTGRLSAEGVFFVPPGGDSPTLRGVSFAIAPAEILAIVGPSSAGKSTLAKIIAGTCMPTHGHLRLDGADLAVWHSTGGSKHIGYLPQDVELFAGTIRQNIARFDENDPTSIVAAARLVGLHDTIMRLPQAYDTQIGDSGLRLSGGLRQRLGLARAAYGSPRLLVLDEPNASLDHDGEVALHNAVQHWKDSGATVVVVTHRPTLLSIADKMLLLSNGCLEAFGTRDAVVSQVNKAVASSRGLALARSA